MHLGIEIGGTKLQLGVGAGDGSPLCELIRLDVDTSAGAAAILEQIERAAEQLLASHDVARVGIGFGGPVEQRGGRVIKSHQVAGWENVPLVRWWDEQFGLPAVLANDCDAAALAEASFGAGRGRPVVFFLTVGTGVGGGLVLGGRLHGAERPAAAEIGHLRLGPEAGTADRTVESLASGPGIVATVQRQLEQTQGAAEVDVQQILAACDGDPRRLTARHVAAAAEQGSSIAARAIQQACRVLGWAIAQVITLLAPDVVVVGGGVSLIGEQRFFEPLRREVARYVFPPLLSTCHILPARLGEQVVVQGALALAAGDR